MSEFLSSIATVSRDTGIAKEVLRKWETRYGFPAPERDDSDNRAYPVAQVTRLKLIKRLLDGGLRPGDVVPLSEERLITLVAERELLSAVVPRPAPVEPLLSWLQERDPALLAFKLRSCLARHGLGPFVLELMPVMNNVVGQAWASGDIAVRDEHVYTEIIQGLVREALSHVVDAENTPRILLTTVEGELHTLGLLMAETVLSVAGAYCISLGAQSPLGETAQAAQDYRADIVGLSFSASFPKRKIHPLLKELRAQLPAEIALWAGGTGVAGMDRTPRGVTLLQTLPEAVQALDKQRRRCAA